MTTEPPPPYAAVLAAAIAAAREAGELLRAEFHRSGGPRGEPGHCPADPEAERLLRRRLAEAAPDYGFHGEEISAEDRPGRDPGRHVWVIDPNDGTRDFQRGRRGAAVSIGLLRAGQPVLGVVYAYAARAGRGDWVTWAEGAPLLRNDRPANPAPPETLLLSASADRRPEGVLRRCRPIRFRAIPSVAYRLALTAAGEAVAAVSLHGRGPNAWDVAGGHALLGAGGRGLWRLGAGRPVTYDTEGRGPVGDCLGGSPDWVARLADRDWGSLASDPLPPADEPFGLLTPLAGAAIDQPDLLERAQALLLGLLLGERTAWWQPAAAAPPADGAPGHPMAGQPGPVGEQVLLLARSVAAQGGFDPAAAVRTLAWWQGLHPEGPDPVEALPARALILATLGHLQAADHLADQVRADAAGCGAPATAADAAVLVAVAAAALLRGEGPPPQIRAETRAWGESRRLDARVTAAWAGEPPDRDPARHRLRDLARSAACLGDHPRPDRPDPVVGGLIGLTHGPEAIPFAWRERLLSCRPLAGWTDPRWARPTAVWPVDAPDLAERLLWLGCSSR